MNTNKTIIWFSRWFYFLLAHLPSRILANAIFFTAIFSLMIQGGLYYAEKHPQKIQQLIADYLLINVSFSAVKTDFNLFFPSMQLDKLTIYSPHTDKPWLSFESAAVSVDLLRSLVSLNPKLNYFSLDGAKTSLTRDAQGNVHLGNLLIEDNAVKASGAKNTSPSPPLWLLSQKYLSLSNSEIVISDALTGIQNYRLNDINIALRNSWWQHQLSISFSNSNGQQEFKAIDLGMYFKGSIHQIEDWKGQFYLSVDGFNFQQTENRLANQLYKKLLKPQQYSLHSAQLNSQIWGKIEAGELKSISGQMVKSQLALFDQQNQQQTQLDNFNFNFAVLNSANLFSKKFASQKPQSELKAQPKIQADNNDVWHFLLADLHFEVAEQAISLQPIGVDIEPIQSDASKPDTQSYVVHSYTQQLQLAPLRPLLKQIFPTQKDAFDSLKFSGQLSELSADFILQEKAFVELQLHAHLQDYQQSAWQDVPLLRNFSAEVWGNYHFKDGQASSDGVVALDSPDLRVKLHTLFRDAWQFDSATGQISWQQIGELTWIDSGSVKLKNNHLNIAGNAQFWLDSNNSPLMIIDAYYNQVNLSYTSRYLPVALLEKGLVNWLDDGVLSGRAPDGGVVFRGRLSDFPYPDYSGNMDIVFNVEDLKLSYQKGWPILTDIKARTTFTEQGMWIEGWHAKTVNSTSHDTRVALNDYMNGILNIQSNVKGRAKDGLDFLRQSDILTAKQIESLASEGDISIDLDLTISTDAESEEVKSRVDVELSKVKFKPAWLLPTQVEEINGKLSIHNSFINATNINGKLNGEKLQINIKTEAESGDVDAITHLQIDTKASIETLLVSGFIPEWLKPSFPRLSGITPLHVNLLIPNNQNIYPQVVILSSLEGIKSDLPKPFNKKAHEKLPFQLSYNENSQKSQFRVKLGKNLNVNSEFLHQESDQKVVKKELNKLSLSFGSQAALIPAQSGVILQGDVDLSELDKWAEILNSSDDVAQEQSAAQGIDFQLPIKLALDSVTLPAWKAADKQEPMAAPEEYEKTPLKVKKLPTVNGYIDKIMVADNNLGRFFIDTKQNKNLFTIKELELKGDFVNLLLSGKWDKQLKKTLTRLEGKVDIEDVGELADIVGYDSITKKAKVNLDGYIKWHGSPLAFDYHQLFGVVKLKSGPGYFADIDPGVGRVLGLFNLNKITKRINLDFSDVSQKGFSFEDISADFLFNENSLYTRDLTINSSMAQIIVDGHLDLVQQKFDELVTITPNISSGLTLAGAAIAGPVGAAAGWLGHTLVGKQVNRISQYQHTIKGSWSEPQISPVKISALIDKSSSDEKP